MKLTTDSLALIEDKDSGRTVTNDAEFVVGDINKKMEEGLGQRRWYYRDTNERYDELKLNNG